MRTQSARVGIDARIIPAPRIIVRAAAGGRVLAGEALGLRVVLAIEGLVFGGGGIVGHAREAEEVIADRGRAGDGLAETIDLQVAVGRRGGGIDRVAGRAFLIGQAPENAA